MERISHGLTRTHADRKKQKPGFPAISIQEKSMKHQTAIFSVVISMIAFVLPIAPQTSGVNELTQQPPDLKQRPLNLPKLKANEPCPVSHGNKELVRGADYVFCSSCFWFGKGPVYLALSFQDQPNDEARFALTTVPRDSNAYSAKTPWVARPDYMGPILVRGGRIDGSSREKLRFSFGGYKLGEMLQLDAPPPGRIDATHWSFWPTGIYVPRAGCYGLQIDTKDGADVVVFEATVR
jgi:hypothetical protein